ncbi:MAG: discoidin domain-containing protein [Desulfosarcina sp.]|nr:discoidin domain-containing protein [Desulfobacterales bacterium]
MTATSNFTGGAGAVEDLIDNDEATYFYGTNNPCWWKVDFGSGNAQDIICFRALCYGSTWAFNAFEIFGSNDDSRYTSIYSGNAADIATWQEFTFTNGTTYRYYRIDIASNHGGANFMYELELCTLGGEIPYDAQDLHDADRAGTLQLWTGTPTTNISLSQQIQPFTELALKIDFTLASSDAGAGDVIAIAGTDKDGGAQTESIDVSAGDGTYTTTKWYATITDVDCNTFIAGTLTIIQQQWGVFDLSDDLFQVKNISIIQLGDASNDGYFAETSKIFVADMNQVFGSPGDLFKAYANKGHLSFGNYDSLLEKTVKDECWFRINGGWITGMIELDSYGSVVRNSDTSTSKYLGFSATTGEMWYNNISGIAFNNAAGLMNFYKNTIKDVQYPFVSFATSGEMYGFEMYNSQSAVVLHGFGATMKNFIARNFTYALYRMIGSEDFYLIDFDVDWTKQVNYSGMGDAYVVGSFNLKITDDLGVGIPNAYVQIRDNVDTLVTDVQADADGVVAEQLLNLGYYSDGGVWHDLTPHSMRIWKYGMQDIDSKFEIAINTNWTLTMYEDPYITKDAAAAALIGSTCNV